MTGRVRLDHVVLAVSDGDRSIAFCRDVLGAQVLGATGPARLQKGDRRGEQG
jgi:catechol 2,3-dioxygenase-like lactoylglutathione lyase family enzyme